VGTSLDLISLVLPLILAVYRIGCLLNGCCYGAETDSFAGLFLPGKFGEWAFRYPTQIMLMLFDVVLFGWLWRMWKRKPTPGDLTLTFLVSYSAGRLVIDAFRDLPAVLGPLSFHQLVALAILAVSVVVALKRRGKKRNMPA
jgi:phosphatidylglycerol:prolipoprotein diacylglycerol transferase